MEHSAFADFHGGLGRKGSWRAPFVFPDTNITQYFAKRDKTEYFVSKRSLSSGPNGPLETYFFVLFHIFQLLYFSLYFGAAFELHVF
ncbi:MAG: hypothetical protein CMP53_07205 [Flavobacteriales bacterium]|nr:hypothetical protein [Flavobacteriales bacterium]